MMRSFTLVVVLLITIVADKLLAEEESTASTRQAKGSASSSSLYRSASPTSALPTADTLETVATSSTGRSRCPTGSTLQVPVRPVDVTSVRASEMFKDLQRRVAAGTGGGDVGEGMKAAVANISETRWAITESVPYSCYHSDLTSELTTMQEGVDQLLYDEVKELEENEGYDVKNIINEKQPPLPHHVEQKVRVWTGPLNPKDPEDAKLLEKTTKEDFKVGKVVDPATGRKLGYFDRVPPTNRFKVICSIYTHSKKHDHVQAEKHAWGHKCDRMVMFTNPKNTPGLGPWKKPRNFHEEDIVELEVPGGERYSNMWQKTRAIFRHLGDHSESMVDPYDFFFIGGDDIMMFPENLHKMFMEPGLLEAHEAGTPLHLGYRHKIHTTQQTFISGAGYVMNRAAVKLFASSSLMDECEARMTTHAEDVLISGCLQRLGISSRDGRDHHGEDRFLVMTPGHHAYLTHSIDYTWWYREYRPRQYPRGLDGVSEYPIFFHFMPPGELRKLADRYYGIKDFPENP